jgi:hypothetical protein
MAKFHVIVWMILWVAAISLFLMGVVKGLDGAHDSHEGSGPQCGAVPTGPFYQALIPKMIGAAMILVPLTLFFSPNGTFLPGHDPEDDRNRRGPGHHNSQRASE